MSELFSGATGWWLGSAIGGGAILLICGLLMRRASSPEIRQRLGELGIVAAVLLAVLRMGPTWIGVPDPWTSGPSLQESKVAATVAPSQTCGTQLVWKGQPKDVITDVPAINMSAKTPELPAAPPAIQNLEPCSSSGWSIGIVDGLLAGYAALVVYFMGRWLLALCGLRRILNRSRTAPEPIQQIFDRLAVATGQEHVRLLVSDKVPVPICCGLHRPTVVIPRSLALESNPVVLRWIFAHELTHLARRDPWSTWLIGFAQTFYFYLPWFWWVRRQVRLCQEYIADRAAAAQGEWADEYAQFLVNLARCPGAPVGATGVLGNTSDLYRRIAMLLKPSAKPAGAGSRRQLISGVSCLFASAIILAGLGVRAETPDDKKKDKDDNVKVEVIVVDDSSNGDDKKDGEKKEVRIKRVAPVAQGQGGAVMLANPVNNAELEKRIRKALEKAKVDGDEIDKVVKEVMKATEQAHVIGPMVMDKFMEGQPKIGQFKALGDKEMHFFPAQGANEFKWAGAVPGLGGIGGGGRLGIMIEKPNAALVDHLGLNKDQGVVIQQVVKGSAAEKAGMKTNDIVLKFADKSVGGDLAAFVKFIDGLEADKEFDAVVLRKGKKETIEGVKLGEKKKAASGNFKVITDGDESKLGERMKVIAELKAKEGADVEGLHKKLKELHGKDAEKHAAELHSKLKEIEKKSGSDKKSDSKTNRTVTVNINDGEYSAKEVDGETSISVTGKMEDGKVKVNSITVNDGDNKSTYKSLEKVPSKFRARVEKLIANAGDSSTRVRIREGSE